MQIPSTLAIKILIGAAALSIAFYSGWRTKSAFVAEAELASVKEENKITEEFRKFEASVSDKLELKLQELKANERVIEREKLKVVQNNPVVYNAECIDAAGLLLIEQARMGKTDPIKPVE